MKRLEYVIDEHVDSEYVDGQVNVKCVLSWSERNGDVAVNLRNGWIFDSRDVRVREKTTTSVLAALRQAELAKLHPPCRTRFLCPATHTGGRAAKQVHISTALQEPL